MPHTVLGTQDESVNKIDKCPALVKLRVRRTKSKKKKKYLYIYINPTAKLRFSREVYKARGRRETPE